MMEMKKYKLGDIAEIIPGYSFKATDFGSGDNIVIKIKDINPFFVDVASSDSVSFSPHKKYNVTKGDYVMAMTGATIGKVGMILSDQENIYINQRVCKFIPDEKICDKLYLFYVLNTDFFRQFVYNNVDSKAAQPNIGHPTLYKFSVQLPPLPEQKHIASVLSALDKKIALNKQINQNLEALTRQLYDYWFVQFDFPNEEGKPYKSSGGKMVYNPILKREIPEGWDNIKLAELIRLEDSKRIPLSTYERENRKGIYPYYGATGIMDYIDDYLFDDEIILLAEDGSTSDKKGFPIVQYVWGKVWVNNHAHIIYPRNLNHKIYTYFLLKQIPAKLIETGSIQKKINQDNLLKYNSIKVPTNILDDFTKIVSPLWRKKMITTEEILSLTKQRDELLPLLMNGQVSVE